MISPPESTDELLQTAESYVHQIGAITKTWQELDGVIAAYQKAAGYQCFSGCGACCKSPTVEATPLECLPAMLPIIVKILQNHSPEEAITKFRSMFATEQSKEGICNFFDFDTKKCTTYATRPTLCRLFAFSWIRSKDGTAKMVVCRKIKEAHRDQEPTAIVHLNSGAGSQSFEAPELSAWVRRLGSIDPALGSAPRPINEAMEQAGLYLLTKLIYFLPTVSSLSTNLANTNTKIATTKKSIPALSTLP